MLDIIVSKNEQLKRNTAPSSCTADKAVSGIVLIENINRVSS